MKASIAAVSSFTLVKLPRRIALRVMIEKNTSTRFIQEHPVGVKCSWMRLFSGRASQVLTFSCLCVL